MEIIQLKGLNTLLTSLLIGQGKCNILNNFSANIY